ncbi:GNAT family N-acetyltransferase [Methylocapsa acidiphila]|uniref:GNAT family N-acetyltransferase n=1 Tax=Methylocapsa acidiphila TaxID=133552 RepID=UPI0004089A72|nr:GNAT family N-acetyltransferase [Methylocapsa acidiphila]
MFPDLTSDDIFRLETKRLWLRWPRASDAEAIAEFASLAETARMTAALPHPYPPGEAERFILKARSDNANGKALVLIMVQKGGLRPAIGVASATLAENQEVELGYVVAPHARGKGYATEAVQALVEAVFSLTNAERVRANSRTINPASRRVLEKCGFAYVDTGFDLLPARGGLHPCDRFQLDRKAFAEARAKAPAEISAHSSGEAWDGRVWSRPKRPMVQQIRETEKLIAAAGPQRRPEA